VIQDKIPPQSNTNIRNYENIVKQFLIEYKPAIQKVRANINQFIPVLETYRKSIAAFLETHRTEIERFLAFTQTVDFKIRSSIFECEVYLHPVFSEIFDSKFSVADIQDSWSQIKQYLLQRFPDVLDKNCRKDRYTQILNCQDIESYIAVCRSIYPEIEALLRDELLFGNPDWRAQWKEKKDAGSRRGFERQKFNELVKNPHKIIELADENPGISEIGIFTFWWLGCLEQTFESFDSAKVDDAETKSFRYTHAHGWAKKASFIDALNGLLLFDMTLQIIDVKEADKLQECATGSEKQ